jgi:TolA-binding protein
MAKNENGSDLPKLTPEEYWEWMTKIENMQRRKAEAQLSEAEGKMMQLEYQNKAMQIQLHNKTRLESTRKNVEQSIGEYKAVKERIESRLGINLNEKLIDENTLEVKEIPKN